MSRGLQLLPDLAVYPALFWKVKRYDDDGQIYVYAASPEAGMRLASRLRNT